MSAYIKPEHLAFLEETKKQFEGYGPGETHRNEDESFIALRYGADRDCIKIFELGEEVAFFTQQIEPCPTFRDEVFEFARDMEVQLKANDHMRGWGQVQHEYLSKCLSIKLEKLNEALSADDKNKQLITKLSADIANYAMMIADNEGEHL